MSCQLVSTHVFDFRLDGEVAFDFWKEIINEQVAKGYLHKAAPGIDSKSFDMEKITKEVGELMNCCFACIIHTYQLYFWTSGDRRLPKDEMWRFWIQGMDRVLLDQVVGWIWESMARSPLLKLPELINGGEEEKEEEDDDNDLSWEAESMGSTEEDEDHHLPVHLCEFCSGCRLLWYDPTFGCKEDEAYVKFSGDKDLRVSKDAKEVFPGVVLCYNCHYDLVNDCMFGDVYDEEYNRCHEKYNDIPGLLAEVSNDISCNAAVSDSGIPEQFVVDIWNDVMEIYYCDAIVFPHPEDYADGGAEEEGFKEGSKRARANLTKAVNLVLEKFVVEVLGKRILAEPARFLPDAEAKTTEVVPAPQPVEKEEDKSDEILERIKSIEGSVAKLQGTLESEESVAIRNPKRKRSEQDGE